MSKIILSIIIPVYNNCNFTKGCIEDLIKLHDDHEIIIVNNASTDNTLEMLYNFSNRVKVITNAENLGFAKACNIGYAASAGNNVLFLNNDIRVKSNHNNWTEEILKYCSDHLVSPNGGLIDNLCNFITETDKVVEGNFYLSGWCLGSSKINFDKLIINSYVGPFSEEFGIAYYEDTDLSFRAAELNIQFKVVDVPVKHFGKMTSKKIGLSSLYLPAQKIFKNKWLNKLQNKESK